MSPVPTFTKLGPQPEFNDIVNKVNTLVAELQNLMLGVDSINVFEVGGWRVTLDQLASSDGDVGMSTVDTAGDDIRFWAGDAITGTPKFKVTKSGIATMVAMVLQSSSSGERVVLDSTGLHAYDPSGVERLTIGTTPALGAKALIGRDSSGVVQSAYTYNTETVDGASRTGQFIVGPDAQYLLLDDAGGVRLQETVSDRGFRALVSTNPQINKGSGWLNIAVEGLAGTKVYYVSDSSGGAVTRKLTFTNGILTSET